MERGRTPEADFTFGMRGKEIVGLDDLIIENDTSHGAENVRLIFFSKVFESKN